MKVAKRITSLFAYYWPPIGVGAVLHYCFNPISFRLYAVHIQKQDGNVVPKILPFSGWFPWDEYKYYGWSYFSQVSGVIGCCMGSICYDQLYVSSLLIICSYLKFLSQALPADFKK